MPRLDEITLNNLISTNCSTNGVGDNTGADLRQVYSSILLSLSTPECVITGGAASFNLTTLPQKLTTFTDDRTVGNDLFTPDSANDKIIVNLAAEHTAKLTFNGEWGANIDAFFQIYVNGAPAFGSPEIIQSGRGPGRSVDMFKEREVPVGVNPPYSYSLPVDVEVYAWAESPTTLTQFTVGLKLKYKQLTIGTI